jgi:hypothetical protein
MIIDSPLPANGGRSVHADALDAEERRERAVVIRAPLHLPNCTHRRGMQIGFSNAEDAKAREDIGIDDAVRLAQEDVFALIKSHRTLDRFTRVRYGTNVRRFFHSDLQSMDRVCDCRPKAPALSRRSLDLPDDGTSARCHAAKPPHLAGGPVFTVQSVATLQRHEECREARMRAKWTRSRKTVGRGFVAGRDAERRIIIIHAL